MSDCNFSRIVSPFTATSEALADGETLKIRRSTVKEGKLLSFTCDIDAIGDGKILIGHGYNVSCGSWLEIDSNTVGSYSFYSWRDPQRVVSIEPVPHEIAISGFLTVSIKVNHAKKEVFAVICSSGGMYKLELRGWSGCEGEIFVMPVGCVLKNCKLNWYSERYASRIWLFGDSYLSFPDPARWPSYLFRDGYADNLLIAGFSGMPTQRGLEEFKMAIEKGTPEFVVWCLGMNNGDNRETGAINQGWLDSTKEFLEICKERGITPILSTIPNTPKVYNQPKNDWVIASGYRYVDFNRAVGADKDENWYPEMLFTDKVHPMRRGAEALYSQVLVDFPEIMQN